MKLNVYSNLHEFFRLYITSISSTFPFIHQKYIINYIYQLYVNKIILIFIGYVYVHSKNRRYTRIT